MYYIIDRIEETIAVCENPQKQMVEIPLCQLPDGTKEGDKIIQTNDGYVLADQSDIEKRIQNKFNHLFHD